MLDFLLALAARANEWENEVRQASALIQKSKLHPLPLSPMLRQALGEVARVIQEAINERQAPTSEGIAVLCADQIKPTGQRQMRCDHVYTLFRYSCLWLSESGTLH